MLPAPSPRISLGRTKRCPVPQHRKCARDPKPRRLVRNLSEQHIRALDEKARKLLAMKAALEHLARGCKGDERPDCPIIDGLAGERAERASAGSRTRRTSAGMRALVQN